MFPGIGTGIFIRNNNKILMSFRKNGGHLALPGGKLEMFEEFQENAIRETKEETNLEIENPQIFLIENVIRKDIQHHFIVIFLVANFNEKAPLINREPEKHSEWEWIDVNQFQHYYDNEKLFYGLMQITRKYGNAQKLFECIFKI